MPGTDHLASIASYQETTSLGKRFPVFSFISEKAKKAAKTQRRVTFGTNPRKIQNPIQFIYSNGKNYSKNLSRNPSQNVDESISCYRP